MGSAHKKKEPARGASSLICNVSGGLYLKFVDKRLVDDDLHGAVQNAKLYGCAAMKLAINLEVYLRRRLYAYLAALEVLHMADRVDFSIE